MAVKGIAVDKVLRPGQVARSEVVEFWSELTLPACVDGVRDANFTADDWMRGSMGDARQVVLRQLGRLAYLARGVVVPVASGSQSVFVLVALSVALAGMLVFSMAGHVLAWVDLGPVRYVAPNVWGFALCACCALLLILMPLRKLRLLRATKGWDAAQAVVDGLIKHCLNLYVSALPGEHQSPVLGGRSAGLAFFCAFVDAIGHSKLAHAPLPWEAEMSRQIDTWVMSVDLQADGGFGPVEGIRDKLDALYRYWAGHSRPKDRRRQSKSDLLAVFSRVDVGKVRQEWGEVTKLYRGTTVDLSRQSGSRATRFCDAYTCPETGLRFLFPRDLDAFLYYLHPWQWRWLALRAAVLLGGLALLSFLGAPRAPVFQLACQPDMVYLMPGYLSPGSVHESKIGDDRLAGCFVRVLDTGFAGPARIDVYTVGGCDCLTGLDANARATNRLSLRTRQDIVEFLFAMPDDGRHRTMATQEVIVQVANAGGEVTRDAIRFARAGE